MYNIQMATAVIALKYIKMIQLQLKECLVHPSFSRAFFVLSFLLFTHVCESKGPSNNKCSKLSEDILDQGKAGGVALARSKAPTTNKALVQNSKLKTSNYCLTGPKSSQTKKGNATFYHGAGPTDGEHNGYRCPSIKYTGKEYTAASKVIPLCSVVKVVYEYTEEKKIGVGKKTKIIKTKHKKWVYVLVNDSGALPDAVIDLSPTAFSKLVPQSKGKIPVTVVIEEKLTLKHKAQVQTELARLRKDNKPVNNSRASKPTNLTNLANFASRH